MPMFIINPRSEAPVPGTQTLQHRQAEQALKRIPVPSSSEKDPLNWPLARKNFILGILCIHSLLAAVLNPILAVNTFQLIKAFNVKFTLIAMLTGYNVLALAIAALFFSATCKIFGRRHAFLLGSVLMVAGCFWAAKANTYHSMLGARILQGIGLAPFEGLVQVVVADMYFVSQRGRAYACVAVAYLAGAMLTPIITGKTDVELGRRAPFYLAGGFTAFFTLVLFFFLEETAFRRHDNDGAVALESDASSPDLQNGDETKYGFQVKNTIERHLTPPKHVVSKIPTFAMANLAPFSGRYSNESFIKLVLRPVILCAHPAVFWGAATTGLITAWSVMLATVIAAIFAFLSPAQIGYLYTGPLIGALISLPISGLSSDYLVKRLTKKYGVYEPEYRLFLIIPFAITATIGLFGFGHSTKMNKVVPATFAGFVVSSICFSTVAASTYVADAYKALDVDCFIAFLLVKNLLAYALTVKGFDWLIADGAVKMFNICGATQLGVCALTIFMFFFGKVIRQWSVTSPFWQYIFH